MYEAEAEAETEAEVEAGLLQTDLRLFLNNIMRFSSQKKKNPNFNYELSLTSGTDIGDWLEDGVTLVCEDI